MYYECERSSDLCPLSCFMLISSQARCGGIARSHASCHVEGTFRAGDLACVQTLLSAPHFTHLNLLPTHIFSPQSATSTTSNRVNQHHLHKTESSEMASTDEPAAKKRKLDTGDIATSGIIYEPPKKHSVLSLYDPELVEITVSDKSRPDPPQRTFRIPKGLLYNRSEYFGKLLNGSFLESRTRTVELQDVNPRTFRCFVGWLYCQRIFLDDLQSSQDTSSMTGPQSNCEESTAASTVIGQPGTEVHDNESKKEFMDDTVQSAADFSPSNIQSNEKPSSKLQTRGEGYINTDNKLSSSRSSISHGTNPGKACPDLDDPITWPWQWLFELYIFADKYSTRQLRMEALVTMQLKLHVKQPRSYGLPGRQATVFAVQNLPLSSPLYRLLADIYGVQIGVRSHGRNPLEQVNHISSLPADFLAACLIALKRHDSAKSCQSCVPGTPHSGECGHTEEDRNRVRGRHPCVYHEHGEDDEEAARCALQWESRKFTLNSPQKETDEGCGTQ